MGLITGLVTLPLAPVRGVVWVAERVLEQAESEYHDEGAIRVQLMDIEAALEAGDWTAFGEADDRLTAAVERLIELGAQQ